MASAKLLKNDLLSPWWYIIWTRIQPGIAKATTTLKYLQQHNGE